MITGEARRYVVGGSDIGAIVGLNPKCTPEEMEALKLGLATEPEENWMMWWGKQQERFVLETLRHRPQFFSPAIPEGQLIVNPASITWKHKEHRWAVATPDGFASIDGRTVLLEVKTAPVKRAEGWGEWGTDQVPAHYACQVLWTLEVLRSQGGTYDEAWVLALFGNREPQRFVIPFDAGRVAWLLEKGHEFHERVEAKRTELEAANGSVSARSVSAN